MSTAGSAARVLRPPRLEDAAALAELSGELGYPAGVEAMASRIPPLLADPAQFARVAVAADGRVCGWVHAARQLVLEYGWRCEVLGLVVGERARGSGLGRLLMEAVEAWAAEQGVTLISLRSNIRRTDAHAFYDHLGYQRVKTSIAFRKELDPQDPRPGGIG